MTSIQQINSRSAELEVELIGELLIYPDKIKIATNLIKPEEFYHHREVFELIIDCFLNDKNTALELKGKGFSISTFIKNPSIRPIPIICRDIRETNNSRKVSSILTDAVKEVPTLEVGKFIADLQQKITSNVEQIESEKADMENLITEFKDKQDFYRDKFKNGVGIIGQSTGYLPLDKAVDGLRPEHLWVIGGYTNTGKTAASLNITGHLIKNKKRVVYYSLEMGQIDILSRLIGILTDQNGTDILKGFGRDEENVDKSMGLIKDSELSIYSFQSEISEIIFSMMREHSRKNVDLFVVDFIQLVNVQGAKSEYETITTSILEFQKTAKRLKVPIIVLSQISNEGARNNDSPIMTFKGSGAIAAAADLAIEIKSGEENINDLKGKLKNGLDVRMKWDIRKNRHGRVGTMEMLFNGKTGVFRYLTDEEVVKMETDSIKF